MEGAAAPPGGVAALRGLPRRHPAAPGPPPRGPGDSTALHHRDGRLRAARGPWHHHQAALRAGRLADRRDGCHGEPSPGGELAPSDRLREHPGWLRDRLPLLRHRQNGFAAQLHAGRGGRPGAPGRAGAAPPRAGPGHPRGLHGHGGAARRLRHHRGVAESPGGACRDQPAPYDRLDQRGGPRDPEAGRGGSAGHPGDFAARRHRRAARPAGAGQPGPSAGCPGRRCRRLRTGYRPPAQPGVVPDRRGQ